jgi:hypothetical protein
LDSFKRGTTAYALGVVLFLGICWVESLHAQTVDKAGAWYLTGSLGTSVARQPAATAAFITFTGDELKGTTASLALGYQFRDGWFAEIKGTRFNTLNHYEAQYTSGGLVKNVMSFYNAEAHESADAYAFNVGKAFQILDSLRIEPFIGLHRYRTSAQGFARTVALDELTGAALIDDYRAVVTERTGYALDYGLGIAVPITRHIALSSRFTHFTEIDRKIVEVGVQIQF